MYGIEFCLGKLGLPIRAVVRWVQASFADKFLGYRSNIVRD